MSFTLTSGFIGALTIPYASPLPKPQPCLMYKQAYGIFADKYGLGPLPFLMMACAMLVAGIFYFMPDRPQAKQGGYEAVGVDEVV